MTVENVTGNRGYQLPYEFNDLAEDVARLVSALSAIDIDIAGLLVAVAGKAAAAHGHVIGDTTGLQGALDAKQDASARGNANGYASLDSGGKVPTSQLPAAILGAVAYQGTWNANTNSPTIPAADSSNRGFYYKVGTAGATTVDGVNDWKVGDWIVSNGTVWDKVDNTDQVVSVAGLQGAISNTALKTALAIAVADITDASVNGRSLISAVNYAAMKVLLAITAADIGDASANGRSLIQAANYATMFGLLKQAATDSATGVAERATTAEAVAGTDDERYVTPAGLAAALAGLSINYGAGNAALGYGAVGTYVLGYMRAAGITDNSTYAGSSIEPAGVGSGASALSDDSEAAAFYQKGGAALSGTWRAMGRVNATGGSTWNRITLFLRIS